MSNTMTEVRAAAGVIGAEVLESSASERFVARFIDRFVAEPQSTWWWQATKGPTEIIEYGNADGLQQIRSRVGGNVSAKLIVTDEQAEPLGVVAGTITALLSAITTPSCASERPPVEPPER